MNKKKLLVLRNCSHVNELVKYEIDEELKSVKCTMTCYIDSRSISSSDTSNFIFDTILRGIISSGGGKVEKTGTAICHEGDEFDLEFGKAIAYSRAKMKCFSEMAKFIDNLSEELSKLQGNLAEELTRYVTALRVQVKDFNEMMDSRYKEE